MTGDKNPWTAEDARKLICQVALSQLKKPYQWGAKAGPEVDSPAAFDCSGLVAWVYRRCGLGIPDGAENQYGYCKPTTNPKPGDLGFFQNEKGIYHVGIRLDDFIHVIEARTKQEDGIGGAVILRPIEKWEAWKHFAGWRVHPRLMEGV